jgi:hypothetical protein
MELALVIYTILSSKTKQIITDKNIDKKVIENLRLILN